MKRKRGFVATECRLRRDPLHMISLYYVFNTVSTQHEIAANAKKRNHRKECTKTPCISAPGGRAFAIAIWMVNFDERGCEGGDLETKFGGKVDAGRHNANCCGTNSPTFEGMEHRKVETTSPTSRPMIFTSASKLL